MIDDRGGVGNVKKNTNEKENASLEPEYASSA